MFNLDTFLGDCGSALGESAPKNAVQDVVARAMATPLDLEATFGPFKQGGVQVLHHADDLTVLNIVWPPGIHIFPHDHQMWAVIGIYAGVEDNTFYRRAPSDDGKAPGLDTMGTVRLEPKQSRALGADAIHSVANPESTPTAAIHVYGGDFFATPRSEFDPQTHAESPYDTEHAMAVFAEANARWQGAG